MPTCLQRLLRFRLLSPILECCYCHMGSDDARSVAGMDETWPLLFTFFCLEDMGRKWDKKK